METVLSVVYVLQLFLLTYFGGTTLYLFIFSVASLLKRPAKPFQTNRHRHITVIIPAFKEDSVIIEVIRSALKQDYPKEQLDILLMADSMKRETLDQLKDLPIRLIEVKFESSTKAKSLQVALENLAPSTEIVLILDADNIMEDHFLQKINLASESEYKVIQCHRIAKNTNTSFALMDAISEEINNNIFRNGHRAVGLSSALIGSAMVFKADVFRKYIPKLSAVGGFDKELELMLLRDRIRIEYLNDAFVLDEKVQSAPVFYRQRKRWISSQVYFFGRDFLASLFHLVFRGNVDYFDKTLQFSLPPRVLLLGMVILACLLSLFLPNLPYLYCWTGILGLITLTLLISIPRKYYCVNTLNAMASLPKIFFMMILIILHIKGSNKEFIHTEHNYTKP